MKTNLEGRKEENKMSVLRASSIPNEYYLGDKPGTLQYSKDPLELRDCIMVDDSCDRGFVLCEEPIEKVTPNTERSNSCDWTLVLMMKSARENGEIWLKAALKNKHDGKIALMTSTNRKDCLPRPIQSHCEGWYIGHYRMSAPVVFWKELAKRIREETTPEN